MEMVPFFASDKSGGSGIFRDAFNPFCLGKVHYQ